MVLDSGLGGLSIYADIARRFAETSPFEEITLTYYNAWPEKDRGYNRISDYDEKIRVFNAALEGTLACNPDLILIACNTLSVIAHDTPFSREKRVPLLDIVDFGVNIIHEALSRDPEKAALILGTLTTIDSGEHKKRLIERGIEGTRIIGQACDQLATRIEEGPESAGALELIEKYTSEAAEKIAPETSPIAAALCCTHYGYSEKALQQSLQKKVSGEVSILNPNREMARFTTTSCTKNTLRELNSETKISQTIVSRIEWDKKKVAAFAELTEKTSPPTATALRNYSRIPHLFTI